MFAASETAAKLWYLQSDLADLYLQITLVAAGAVYCGIDPAWRPAIVQRLLHTATTPFEIALELLIERVKLGGARWRPQQRVVHTR